MQTTSRTTRVLAGALALGLTVAFAGFADIAQARGGAGGGGGATGGTDISLPTDRGAPPPRGGRGIITYTNEFPEEDPPIIIIPLPPFVRAAPTATGYHEHCVQTQYRPAARIVCERVFRR